MRRIMFALGAGLAISTAANAACTQADLTGLWRFQFNRGAVTSNQVMMMDCRIAINQFGVIVPRGCEHIFASGTGASVVVNTPSRRLRVNNECSVSLTGTPSVTSDITLKFETEAATFNALVNTVSLSLSPDKNMMLGYVSYVPPGNDFRQGSVVALRLR